MNTTINFNSCNTEGNVLQISNKGGDAWNTNNNMADKPDTL